LEGLVFDERGKLEVPGEKFLRAKERTDNKLYPHNYGSMAGFEPGPQWWEANVLTTVPLP